MWRERRRCWFISERIEEKLEFYGRFRKDGSLPTVYVDKCNGLGGDGYVVMVRGYLAAFSKGESFIEKLVDGALVCSSGSGEKVDREEKKFLD
ncbi:hypothetical protein Tco_0150469 [Tanacetum coccineum]